MSMSEFCTDTQQTSAPLPSRTQDWLPLSGSESCSSSLGREGLFLTAVEGVDSSTTPYRHVARTFLSRKLREE